MIDFYNAFISYKHAPLDSKVAEHVQRNLERFRIPHAIRKATGRQKIERIFRDKDELPITSDLSDIISNALSKAEYLIVICSPNTKKSVWVSREIEYFLRNHTSDQILTVLAEGEPEDVIPDEIKYVEKEMQDVSGTTTKVRVLRDMLSCDYRMPFSKAKKLELPRLASTLIGCSYDELVRRQRSYRLRRIMVIVAALILAAVGFGTYMTISKNKVNAALEQALINRSRYLAAESDDLFDQQRRREALYVAMAALPSDDNSDIPVTGEAVSSLAQASYAYRALQGVSLAPVWDYSNGNIINDYWVNEAGTRLAVADYLGIITLWDTQTHSTVFTIDSPGLFTNDCVITDEAVVLSGVYAIRGFDPNTGELLWTFIDVEEADGAMYLKLILMDDGKLMSIRSDGRISIIDPATGESVMSAGIPNPDSDLMYRSYALSPEGDRLAFCALDYSRNESVIGVFNIETDQVVYSEPSYGLTDYLYWAGDSRLMAMSYDMDAVDTFSLTENSVLASYERTVCCYDPQDMHALWDDSLACSGDRIFAGFNYLTQRDLIGCYSGNRFNSYDIDTGDLVSEWVINDTIVDASHSNDEGLPVIITGSGEVMIPALDLGDTYVRSSYDFAGDISGVEFNNGAYYVLQEYSDRIICYNTGVYDEEWVRTDGVAINNVSDEYLDDNVMVIVSETEMDMCINLINPNNNTLTGSVLIDEENMLASFIDILGADEDNFYIVCTSNDTGLVLYTIDILDASYTRTVLSDEISLYDGGISYSDGYLCYVISVDDRPVIAIRPAAGGSVELFDVPEEVSFDSMQTPSFFPESSYIYLPSVYSDYIINTETGECTEVEIPGNWNGTRIIRYDQLLGEFVVSDLMNVLFVTPDSGDVYYSVDNTGIMITGLDLVTIGDDYLLLVAYNGGSLIRYNAYTGEYVGNSDLTNSTAYDFTEFDLDEDAGVLYVQQDRLISIVDINDWVETSAILNSIGHHSPTDRFYTLSYENADGIHVGYFRHYSLEELIARANNMLGGVPVPDDLVRRYGL